MNHHTWSFEFLQEWFLKHLSFGINVIFTDRDINLDELCFQLKLKVLDFS